MAILIYLSTNITSVCKFDRQFAQVIENARAYEFCF